MEPEVEVAPTEQETVVAEDTTDTQPEAETNWQEVAEKHHKAFNDQKLRAEKAEAELKRFKKPEPVEKPSPKHGEFLTRDEMDDLRNRVRLEARGVLEADEQDEVIRAAKVLGIDPLQAIGNDLVKAKLDTLRSQKKTEEVSPSPSKRNGSGGSTVERIAQKVIKGEQSLGTLDGDTKTKVLEYIEKNNLF